MEKNIKNFRSRLIWRLNRKGRLKHLSDKTAIKLLYWAKFHRWPDLKEPKTFNEKLQWLKLNDRNPLYTTMVDKYKVKEYVANLIGEEYVVPLLGVWNDVDDIDFDTLPNEFVLKTNHAGGVYICVDKKTGVFYNKAHERISKEEAVSKLASDLKIDYYSLARSWQYKNVPRKIIAEEMLDIGEDSNITDYKFFCFDGKVKFYYIVFNNKGDTRCTFFDNNNEKIDVWQHDTNDDVSNIVFPKNLELMKELAEKLSINIPHVRVDLYEVKDKVYFGEYTFHNWAGFCEFHPYGFDEYFGEYVDLSKAYCYKENNKIK